jgi:patatin-like phospholipase/acyl hydrolase
LWQIVRASTAAPAYFDPESITIATAPGKKPAAGDFIDGGMSPFNNPALMAMMYATMDGYRIGWPTGADKLLLVSVGTGAADPAV